MDEFLHKYRHSGSLEEIRDDLGIYLKVLRSEMIELINEDYVDFVNLSANLIGLDQSIGTIKKPLDDLRNEIVGVKCDLEANMEQIRKALEEKRSLDLMSRDLQSMKKLGKRLEKSEQQLSTKTVYDLGNVERMSQDFVHLRDYFKYSEKYLKGEVIDRVREVSGKMMNIFRTFFLDAIRTSNRTDLEASLRIYATINECTVVENIYRSEIVSPYLESIATEQSLQNSPTGLPGIYDRILEFIEIQMRDLLAITKLMNDDRFDFLTNSFWTEVEKRLEVSMSSIFAPGNPNFFYQKYTSTMDFLKRLETHMKAGVDLRCHKQYKSFQTRWNLPVYFQIRFQEIGGAVEGAFCKEFSERSVLSPQSSSKVRLTPIAKALENVSLCWAEGVYLDPLMARFLKLTLQIYARISAWIDEIANEKQFNPKMWSLKRADILMIILSDIVHIKQSIAPLIDTVFKLLTRPANISIDRCFGETLACFKRNEEVIHKELFDLLLFESQLPIKQVTDIPRLYRKTNRDVPTKACPYVDEMLKPIIQFAATYKAQLGAEATTKLLVDIFSKLNIL